MDDSQIAAAAVAATVLALLLMAYRFRRMRDDGAIHNCIECPLECVRGGAKT